VHGYQLATSPPSRFRSFPAYLPIGSLDKAFLRGPFSKLHARIARSKTARDASDHLPLVIDLELMPPVADVSIPQSAG
jgi:endonuclease/exonuclease/phosphatase family metal-dependent hydrolase